MFNPSLPPAMSTTTRTVSEAAAFSAARPPRKIPAAAQLGRAASAAAVMQDRAMSARRSIAISSLLLDLILGARHQQIDRPTPEEVVVEAVVLPDEGTVDGEVYAQRLTRRVRRRDHSEPIGEEVDQRVGARKGLSVEEAADVPSEVGDGAQVARSLGLLDEREGELDPHEVGLSVNPGPSTLPAPDVGRVKRVLAHHGCEVVEVGRVRFGPQRPIGADDELDGRLDQVGRVRGLIELVGEENRPDDLAYVARAGDV